jgi:hypothetical protein
LENSALFGLKILDSYEADNMTIVVLFTGTKGSWTTENFSGYKTAYRNISDNIPHKDDTFLLGDCNVDMYNQLFCDFQDDNVVALLTQYSNIIALMPSVRYDGDSLSPVIRVIVKSLEFCPAGEGSVPDSVVLSNKIELPLHVAAGWLHLMSHDVTLGDSIGCDNSAGFGSIGGLLTSRNQTYVLTCEHVTQILKKESVDTAPVFECPSRLNRKYDLLTKCGISYVDQNTGNVIPKFHFLFDRLLCDHADQVEEKIGNLKAIGDFLDNRWTLSDECVDNLPPVSCSVNGKPVEIGGDAAAILVRNLDKNQVQQLVQPDANFQHCGVMRCSEVHLRVAKRAAFIVKKKGASTQTTEGVLRSGPCHIHINYRSPTLLDVKNISRVLLNQYAITSGDTFGRHGDSGGVVYHVDNGKTYTIGHFVGGFDHGLYIATPADFVIGNDFEYVPLPINEDTEEDEQPRARGGRKRR